MRKQPATGAKNAKGNYDLSIEKFVSLVQEYCAKKGPNHHVIFLVDEIGQYIADDTQLMLNLRQSWKTLEQPAKVRHGLS